MQDLPHHYAVAASAENAGNVVLSADNVANLESAPPTQFGGPGDQWSPESLLVAAVADCFILSFRAIARASRFEWISLSCEVEGVLDRVERAMQFTQFSVNAKLLVAAGTNEAKAMSLLEKAEATCLITNSLKAPSHLDASITIDSQ